MNRFRAPLIYLFFFTSFFAASCGNKKRVDVSKIKLDIHIERFDHSLDSVTPANVSSLAPVLQKRYGSFYSDYIEQMLGIGSTRDTTYYTPLRQILQSQDYRQLKTDVNKTFPHLKETELKLTDAFKHIRYYYPKKELPRVISFVSGFAVQVSIGNDYIGIGLDMFLGDAGAKYYKALSESMPRYLSRNFTAENITPRVVETFAREELFPESDADRSLLAKMVYNGKIMYFMNAVMPDMSDSLIIRETGEQLEWCKTNEVNIWTYFVQDNLLFETDYMKIQKYLTEAPFTPGIGEDNKSAPKLGIWTGWQIVKAYMEKNPDVTLQKLMQETDYQKILNLSRYKPK